MKQKQHEIAQNNPCQDDCMNSLLGDMSLVYKGIGGKIRALREEREMTLEDLGKNWGFLLPISVKSNGKHVSHPCQH